ncbi:hypothetical protein [Streptomyces sp. NBC_00102]|uniref:hypothetical protein n=1 Tax=Streptomyces sp. NBC_00102 TaxID=2975652 RepID=UPI0022545EE4|nr:hypothetical protein [Streptomyces sp. NBC_00102]MCX5395615.1 hypothetical protein [Streptomyces sp. NBC_00102]
MSDGMSEDFADVVGVLTERIEARFDMKVAQLTTAVAAAPTANPDATDIVKWYDLLVEAQGLVERAEEDLLAALQTQPSEIDDPAMDLAHRVNSAVTTRDGRAMVVRWLLEAGTPGQKDLAAERLARLRSRTGPAVQTSAPQRPAATTAPTSAWRPARATR